MYRKELEQKIADNEKLVYFVIHRHFPYLYGDDDIVQCGRIGLWKACEHFDNEKSKFSTFAVKCIYNEIIRELRARKKEQSVGYIVSLDEVVGTDNEDNSDITVGQMIPSIEEGYSLVDYDLSFVKKKMPKRCAEVFDLYIHGFTAAEISRAFGFSRTWASNLIRDAQYIARRELLG